jgi:hypothetical protein
MVRWASMNNNINSSTPFLQNDPLSRIATYWYKVLTDLYPGGSLLNVPVTGFNITIPTGISTLILDPAGVLATGTVIMPTGAQDGTKVTISSSQTITALTVSPNKAQNIKNAPTTLVVSTISQMGYSFIFNAANSTWYRIL